jgi:hypothetical protein
MSHQHALAEAFKKIKEKQSEGYKIGQLTPSFSADCLAVGFSVAAAAVNSHCSVHPLRLVLGLQSKTLAK